MSTTASSIEFRHVTKSYPGQAAPAVNDLTLTIPAGEMVMFVGPSGCGKTTSLKMINRLIEPTSGQILIDGEDVTTQNPTQLRRSIGYVIQGGGLLPHLTVADNIAMVPKLLKWNRSDIHDRVDQLLEMTGLEPNQYRDRYPRELSGGQQQRVGVARGLAADPPVVLMDEPFGAVDPLTRQRLQDELLTIQDELSKTIVFVTHDLDEAITLGDRILILQEGAQVAQYDTPDVILSAPANDFVANFIGEESRQLKRLSLLRIAELPLRHPETVEVGEPVTEVLDRVGEAESLIVLDAAGRPLDRIFSSELTGHETVPRPNTTLTTTVDHASTLAEALDAMLLSEHGGALVTRRGRYQGVISYEAVADYVRDHQAQQDASALGTSCAGDGA